MKIEFEYKVEEIRKRYSHVESIEDVDYINVMRDEIKKTILKDVNIQLYGVEDGEKMEGKLVYEVESNYSNPLNVIMDLNQVFSFLRIRLQMDTMSLEPSYKRKRIVSQANEKKNERVKKSERVIDKWGKKELYISIYLCLPVMK